jgi:hypothetical protein
LHIGNRGAHLAVLFDDQDVHYFGGERLGGGGQVERVELAHFTALPSIIA